MAIASGVRQHAAWLEAAGQRWPLEHGHASLAATRESSSFHGGFPMSLSGAEDAFANADSLDASIIVMAGSGETTLVKGELDTAEFDYDTRVIRFSGRCKSTKLHTELTNEKFLNQNPDQIIQKLAQRAGLSANVSEMSLKAGRIWNQDWVKITDNVTLAAAIHKLTEFMGARWWVDANGVLQVKGVGDTSGVYTINYQEMAGIIQSDALGLRVRRNYQAGKDIEVTVQSWNQKEAKAYTSKKTIKGKGGTAKYNYTINGLTQKHVDKHASARAVDHAKHELALMAHLVGDPSCVAGMGLQLTGTAFAQMFEIDQVDHEFGMRGYRMSVTARNFGQNRDLSEVQDVPLPPKRPQGLGGGNGGVPIPPRRPAGV